MYNFKEIENKWQKYWEDNKCFKALDDYSKPKFYALVEFPYPSGVGMHLGHIKAYSGLEVVARKRRMEGYNVLFPIGYDAFGLPTENSAIKQNIHPRVLTDRNIEIFAGQLKKVGFSFDWDRVIDTTDENYYKWTQWIFLKMFEKGLAFRDKTLVNYCPSCRVVLANEDSQGGKCDVCHSQVIQKEKDVWYLRITEYADKLLEGLKEVDYLPNIKLQQENWIGKSTGAYVDFKVKDLDEVLKVYTTRPDTLFGATFMVVAPEHHIIDNHKDMVKNMDEIMVYREEAKKKTEFERVQLAKDKTGVRIDGLVAINPVNGAEIPIYIADYVMMGYGTGAIMAVPAHDTRDYEFATKFGIDIIPVIEGGDIEKEAYTGDGVHINSGFLDGLNKKEAIEKVIEYLKEKKVGEKAVQYKMKDWAFNRQRYWGEPIPIIHCAHCGDVAVPYEELPLRLPEVTNFEVGTDGESPLAKIESFVNCKCPKCGRDAKRETDTMPQWAGSSWYFLRYIDPHNDKEFASREKLNYWMPVDWYNGGMEHVTRHVIYSRFWYHFLYDLGLVPTSEPYMRRTAQGLILGPDGEKMSKSRGNTIDPNTIVDEYGADTLRTYVLFMGDYGLEAPWNEQGVKGISRFLDRVYRLSERLNDSKGYTSSFEGIINKTIKKVSDDIETLKYNTAISELMKLVNEYYAVESISKDDYTVLLTLLYPFAPHITEELNEKIGNSPICKSSWPKYDEAKTIDETKEIAVQVNGKVRGTITINVNDSEDTIKEMALNEENVKRHTEGKDIVKVIVIKGKIVNIVVK
ncbi:MAG: leucine--tRNA ligase [Tenericutes bacterium]|nr:leucine--tRNA ligase [Mycoplasmatota bacterium]